MGDRSHGKLGPLHGLRVLELSADIGGQYAGRLLALLGANVTKVDHVSAADWICTVPPLPGGAAGLHELLSVSKPRLELPASLSDARDALRDRLTDAELLVVDASQTGRGSRASP